MNGFSWIASFDNGSSMHSGSVFIDQGCALEAAINYCFNTGGAFSEAILSEIKVYRVK